MRTVLVIDDDPDITTALEVLFSLRDIKTIKAHDPDTAVRILAQQEVGLVISDMNFDAGATSGVGGTSLFKRIRELHPDLPIILLTAWASVETAVHLVKAGASDYISKPWDDAKLLAGVENLLELSEANRERLRMHQLRKQRRDELNRRYTLDGIVFASDVMERTIALACKVARADVPVLITGPNGAGKERIAEIVHKNSKVSDGPFLALNCGAIPENLVEAELFGAEKGAYTGANQLRQGSFEMANNGTLFLDEIGSLPVAGQVKLLRVLETGQFHRLGSSKTLTTNARIVSATNADLPQMIAAGDFREDLYYRLNMIEIDLPPLNQRREDIPVLAQHFLGTKYELSDDAINALSTYDWPGNVRELRNVIERTQLLISPGIISKEDLNLPSSNNNTRDYPDLDRETIEQALHQYSGNISRAAQNLGLSRQALYRRMDRFGLRD